MTGLVGTFLLALSLCAALATAIASAWPGERVVVVRRCALACLIAAAGTVATAEWALIGHDFSVRFVAENGSRATPLFYTVTSLWAAHDGSLLLWCLILAAYLAVLARRRDPLRAVAVSVTAGVAAFFLALAFFTGGVFDSVSPVPADGPGPTPLLADHPAMGLHPPLLYLGLTGMVVPFGYAVGGLVTGQVGRRWLAAVDRPLRFAWTVLTAGILLGAWWSYAVLGWGGYWSWDPVENASLMPWLLATALLHSVMVQRRRGALPAWNLSLAIGAFLLAALGVLLTRSGVVASVHSFADSGIGPVLLGFVVALLVGILALVVLRVGRLAPPRPVGPGLSRGSALLAGNLVLFALCVTVLLGTVLPVLAEAAGAGQLSVGAPYYDRMAVPLMLLILLLMAVGPVLRWERDQPQRVAARLAPPLLIGAVTMLLVRLLAGGSPAAAVAIGLAAYVATSTLLQAVAEWRLGRRRLRRQRIGGVLAHLAFAVLAVGVTASSGYASAGEVTLHAGQPAHVQGMAASLGSVQESRDGQGTRTVATVMLGGHTLRPALRYFAGRQTTVPLPAIDSGLRRDVYVTLLDAPSSGSSATLRVAVNPMVGWVWAGGLLLVIGGALGLRRPRRRAAGPAESSPAVAVPARSP
jgi:cytochrome c-type biogenesis protein CcmF